MKQWRFVVEDDATGGGRKGNVKVLEIVVQGRS